MWNGALTELGIDFTIRPYNDGSKDDSLAVMRRIAADMPRVDVRDKPNGGHGNTILTGYRQAVLDGFDWIFQIDSDDEMGPEKFTELWSHRADYDFLVGIRDGRVQQLPRKIISFVSRCCVKLFYGHKTIWDVNTPYRLMRSAAFASFYSQIPLTTFAPNVILSGLVDSNRLRFFETRVPQHDRTTGEVSIKKWKLLKAAMKSMCQTVWFAATHTDRLGVHLAGLVFSLWAVVQSPIVCFNHYHDQWLYLLAGQRQNQGDVLYVNFFDYKGPVFHLFYRVGSSFFDFWGVWALEMLIFGSALFALHKGIKKNLGWALALFACLLAIAVNRYPFYPESLAYEFAIMAVGLVLCKKENKLTWAAAGCIGALCVFVKQTCIVPFLCLCLYCFFDLRAKEVRHRLLYFFVGGVVTVVGIMSVLYFEGMLTSYINCCWLYNIKYASAQPGTVADRLVSLLFGQLQIYAVTMFSVFLLLSSRNFRWAAICFVAIFLESVLVVKGGRVFHYRFGGLHASAFASLLIGVVSVVSHSKGKRLLFCLYGFAFFLC